SRGSDGSAAGKMIGAVSNRPSRRSSACRTLPHRCGRKVRRLPVRYLMLVCVDEETAVEVDPTPWLDEVERRGIRQGGDRLQPVRDSTTVRVRGGEVLIADGPFAETKEQI